MSSLLPLQVMGDELVQILESQRQLERQFEWQTEGGGGGIGDQRDYAHSMASAAQGKHGGSGPVWVWLHAIS